MISFKSVSFHYSNNLQSAHFGLVASHNTVAVWAFVGHVPETVHTKRDGCADETEEAKQPCKTARPCSNPSYYPNFCGCGCCDGGSTIAAHSRHWVLVVHHPRSLHWHLH